MDKLLVYLHDLRWAFFGLIGGAVGYILRTESVKPRDLIIEALGAAFVGAVVGMAAQYYELGAAGTGALVGASSLIGARTLIGLLREYVLGRFAKKSEKGDDSAVK